MPDRLRPPRARSLPALRGAAVLLALVPVLGACAVRFVSPYDAVIDDGLRDYRESINVFVMNMAETGGTPAGTHAENRATYNQLEAKIDLLIARAELEGSGRGCRLGRALTDRVVRLAGQQVPQGLAPEAQTADGDASGCTHRMLVLIRENLLLLEQIHRSTDRCGPERNVSCIRAATAKTALATTNQAINAAWVVEIAKKDGKAE